jgi:hypothetical protein
MRDEREKESQRSKMWTDSSLCSAARRVALDFDLHVGIAESRVSRRLSSCYWANITGFDSAKGMYV